MKRRVPLLAAALAMCAGTAIAQTNPAAGNPVLTTPPNAGTGPSSSIGPNSARGGPAIPGTSIGTGGAPAAPNTGPLAAPADPVGRSSRCDLLSGMDKDKCLRDESSASNGTGSPDRAGPGSTGMGTGR